MALNITPKKASPRLMPWFGPSWRRTRANGERAAVMVLSNGDSVVVIPRRNPPDGAKTWTVTTSCRGNPCLNTCHLVLDRAALKQLVSHELDRIGWR